MGRFKLRWGDREIEYEGEDADKRFETAFDWLKDVGLNSKSPDLHEKTEQTQRGGARKAIFAPEIKKLLDDGFFKLPNRKTTSQVLKALEDRGIPISGKEGQIVNACKRLLRRGLSGTKTEDGSWTFWQE